MSTHDVVDFAQTNFGEDAGLPSGLEGRPRLPTWLEGRIEARVPIDSDDVPRIEGGPEPDSAPDPSEARAAVDDVFAFYLPFHFYKRAWGIYVRAHGVGNLARLLTAPRPVQDRAIHFAFLLLVGHERLHFIAELAASRLEVAWGLGWYRPYFENPNAGLHEEALANAYTISSVKGAGSVALLAAARSWMSNQPAGYRDFNKWLGRDLTRGKRQAAAHMMPGAATLTWLSDGTWKSGGTRSARPTTPASEWPREFLFDEPRRWDPPTYLVVDKVVPWLRFVRRFPKRFGLQVHVRTNDHQPPHIHVQVIARRLETRYEWPTWPRLRRLRGDPPLSKSEERHLLAYLEEFRGEIDAKVNSVTWN